MIQCKDCRSDCCGYIAIEIDEPGKIEDFDEIRWFLGHKNVRVYLDSEGDWIVEFKTRCRNLDKNHKCMIYRKRPKICREHGMDECVQNGEGNAEQILFESMEEAEEYAKKQFPGKKPPWECGDRTI